MSEKGKGFYIVAGVTGVAGLIITAAGMNHMTNKIRNFGIKESQDVQNSDQKQIAQRDSIIAELNKIINCQTSIIGKSDAQIKALELKCIDLTRENYDLKARLSLHNSSVTFKDYKKAKNVGVKNA